MFQEFFQLNGRPFNTTPFAPDYFPARYAEQSRQAARIALREGTGTVLIIGQTGVGKSMMLAVLAEEFRNEFAVVNLTSTSLASRRDLLQNILFELDRPYQGKLEGELRLDLMEHLKPGEKCPNGVLALVDEAHCLPDEVLDELKSISNYHRDGKPRVRLALAGNARLEEKLAKPALDSLSQRISCRCYLQPLSMDEIQAFVDIQLNRVGSSVGKVFEPTAIEALAEISNGIPRVVNQICCHAMILAACNRLPKVSRELIGETWADIQKLPNPWAETREDAVDSDDWSVVEFGELDDSGQRSEQQESVSHAEPKAPSLELPAMEETAESDCSNTNDVASNTFDSARPQTEDQWGQSIDTATIAIPQFEQPAPSPTMQQPQQMSADSAEPLFGDGFDDEEEVADEFTRWAADQNRSSLEVTKSQLGDLTAQAENIRHQMGQQNESPEIGPEVILGVSSETQSDQSVENTQPTEQDDANDDPEIKQMFEIYDNQKQLAEQVAVAVKPVDHGDQFNFGDPRTPNPTAIEYPIEEHAAYRKTFDAPLPDNKTDDRDMLVVSHVEEHPSPKQPQPETDEPDQATGSSTPNTGSAIRMSYQELFERLRDDTQTS